MKYSVLMSVYYKEKPEYLEQAIESMMNQTIPTDDFVLVCDGPLGSELDNIIRQAQDTYGKILKVVRLKKNSGLGNSLNYGMKYCKHDLIARMDSDDISMPNRCEKEMQLFEKNFELDIVSGTVLEFQSDTKAITGTRKLPKEQNDIKQFSKKRNPFNHPAVMFRKKAVEEVGGYQERYPLFEDYYLWIRMFQNGSIGENLQEPILYMRTPTDMYLRRGGMPYAKNMLQFHRWLIQIKWSTILDYCLGVVPHAIVCMLPNMARVKVYNILHS